MTELIIPAEAPAMGQLKVRPLDRFARGVFLKLLGGIERGRVHLVDGAERHSFGRSSERFPLEATITVRHRRFYGDSLFGGTIGAAEAYMAGFWTTDDLTALVRIFTLHPELFGRMDKGFARLMAPLYQAFHAARKNTRAGSRRNIVAHYDLGNEFYRLFLDDTLTYSCGIFEREDASLREASIAKYERICRKLALSPADHVLEIGTGWGGFAIHAAGRYGCRVTTTTISGPAARAGGRAHRGGGPRGPGHAAQDGLPRPDRDLRQARLDRDDRGRGAPLPGRVFPGLRPAPEARRRDAAAGHHHPGPGLRAPGPPGRLHQALHLPGQLHPVGHGDRRFRDPRERPAHRPPGRHHPPLRAHAAQLAGALLRQHRPGPGARLPRRASSACGSSTSATARAASRSATWATCRCS